MDDVHHGRQDPTNRFLTAISNPSGSQDQSRFSHALLNISAGLRAAAQAAAISVWVPHPSDDGGSASLSPAFSDIPQPTDQGRWGAERVFAEESRCGVCFREQRSEWWGDLDQKPLARSKSVLLEQRLTKMGCFPLMAKHPHLDHDVIAIAVLHYLTDDAQAEQHFKELAHKEIGWLAGREIEHAMAIELDMLVKHAFQALTKADSDPFEAMNGIAEMLRDSLEFEACSLLVAEDQRRLVRMVGSTSDWSTPMTDIIYEYGERGTGLAAEQRRVIATEDITKERWFSLPRKFPETVATPEFNQFLAVPVLSESETKSERSGKLLGVLRLRNKRAPGSHPWPRCLTFLDEFRAKRAASVVAPVMSLLQERFRLEMLVRRRRHDMKAPATAIRNALNRCLALELVDIEQIALSFNDRAIVASIDTVKRKLDDSISLCQIIIWVAELLQYSQATDIPIKPRYTELSGAIVAKLCNMMNPIAKNVMKGSITFDHRSFVEHFPAVFVDQNLVQIALYNLLDNAIKYSHKDSMNTISVTASNAGLNLDVESDPAVWFQIHVCNYGTTISAEAKKRLFTLFYRAPEVQDEVTGTGVGLHTSRELMRLHGGDIILSKQAPATVFTMLFPRFLASRPPRKEDYGL